MTFWPEGRLCAVSLTFDDGLESQLAIAVPEMDRREIHGTFYLNPRDDPGEASQGSWRKRLQRWKGAQASGHEMGNHSINHPCSLNIDVSFSPNNLQRMSLPEIEHDLAEAQARIEQVFPSQAATSFAYPCYETSLGRGLSRTSYVPVVARMFVAGRARGELANDPIYCDLHHLSSFPAERMPAPYLIGLVEQAIALHRWAVFTFHGINEGHLPVSQVDLVELLDHLVRRRDVVWTATAAEVAVYIQNKINNQGS